MTYKINSAFTEMQKFGTGRFCVNYPNFRSNKTYEASPLKWRMCEGKFCCVPNTDVPKLYLWGLR
jgi:hypothetical protein